jgi:hypothetical protein
VSDLDYEVISFDFKLNDFKLLIERITNLSTLFYFVLADSLENN